MEYKTGQYQDRNNETKKTILVSILVSYAFISISSQEKKFNFFGSYNYGFGNLTAKVNSSLGYPLSDEVQKAKIRNNKPG